MFNDRVLAQIFPMSVALCLVLTLGFAYKDPTPLEDDFPWPVSKGAAPGYVPDSACAECHEDRFDSFQHSPMSRSFFAMKPDRAVEDFSNSLFFHEASGNTYETIRRGDEFFQRRWRTDANGERYAEIERRIDWVMGSGTHARTYCYQVPSGEIFQMPVTWYDGLGFAMSPGYDHADHLGFRRPISRRCMSCHNAFGDSPRGSDQHGEIASYSADLPEGINCQRCHGPGAEHVRLALDPDVDEDVVQAAIVHPAKIAPVRANDICFQCHLQPTTSVADTVRRVGRGTNSYKPGQPLEDYIVHFDIRESGEILEERFEINHHAFRLMQSPCFQQSEGQMKCITCHSPHNRPTIEQRPAFYRRKCLQCHEIDSCTSEQRGAGHLAEQDDCAGCHMPLRRTQDVVLATTTDHLIRRLPAPDSWMAPLAEELEIEFEGANYFFADRGPAGADLALHQALFQVRNGSVEGLPVLQELVTELQPDSAEPYLDLGEGYLKVDLLDGAITNFKRLTELFPKRSVGWRKLGQTLMKAGRSSEARSALDRALTLAPEHPDNHFALAEFQSANRLPGALKHYRLGLTLRPDDAKALAAMARVLHAEQKLARAADKLEQALTIAPRNAEYYRELADIRLEMGRWTEAMQAWSRGAEVADEDADFQRKLALGWLTLPLESERDAEAALKHARRAEELSLSDADVATEIALALLLLGRHQEALSAVRNAEQMNADRCVTLGISALLFEQMNREPEAERARLDALAAQSTANPGALRRFVIGRLQESESSRRK